MASNPRSRAPPRITHCSDARHFAQTRSPICPAFRDNVALRQASPNTANIAETQRTAPSTNPHPIHSSFCANPIAVVAPTGHRQPRAFPIGSTQHPAPSSSGRFSNTGRYRSQPPTLAPRPASKNLHQRRPTRRGHRKIARTKSTSFLNPWQLPGVRRALVDGAKAPTRWWEKLRRVVDRRHSLIFLHFVRCGSSGLPTAEMSP